MADKPTKTPPTPKPAKKPGAQAGVKKTTMGVPVAAELVRAIAAHTGSKVPVVLKEMATLFNETAVDAIVAQLEAKKSTTGTDILAATKAKLFHPETLETPAEPAADANSGEPLATPDNV